MTGSFARSEAVAHPPASQVTWMTSPVYTVFAQQFLPTELWVPFFTFMQFLTGVSAHAAIRSPEVSHI